MKQPRPTVAEKMSAKLAATNAPVMKIEPTDIANVLFGARRGLAMLGGTDLVNVSTSIARLEQMLEALHAAKAKAAAPEAQPAPEAAAPAEPKG